MRRLETVGSFVRHFGGLVKTEVFDSPIQGKGLRAVNAVCSGRVIGFYGGRKYDSPEAWAASGAKDGRYLFYIGNGVVIDGKRSKLGRINHSCDPNTTSIPVVIGGQAEVMFLTQRDVGAGEELTIDYNIHCPGSTDVDLSSWVCSCKADRCRGWMWNPGLLKTINARRKLAGPRERVLAAA